MVNAHHKVASLISTLKTSCVIHAPTHKVFGYSQLLKVSDQYLPLKFYGKLYSLKYMANTYPEQHLKNTCIWRTYILLHYHKSDEE